MAEVDLRRKNCLSWGGVTWIRGTFWATTMVLLIAWLRVIKTVMATRQQTKTAVMAHHIATINPEFILFWQLPRSSQGLMFCPYTLCAVATACAHVAKAQNKTKDNLKLLLLLKDAIVARKWKWNNNNKNLIVLN